MSAIEVRGLCKSFGAHVALAPLQLAVERGAVCGLVGPNGSGKSTFMRLLIGLVPPSAGTAAIDGVALAGDGLAVRRRATFAPGEIASYGELSCDQQLAFLLRGRERDAHTRARAFAQRLGLPLGARMRTFSHGMKRQVAFCAALAPDVPVRLLDEPTAGLDPSKRGEVIALLGEDAREGRCVLLSSHHFGEIARVCERIVCLSKGRVVADEDTRALERRARRLVTLEFELTTPAAQLARVAGALGATARVTVPSAGTPSVGPSGGTANSAGARVSAELAGDDPLAALRALPGDLPTPISVAVGKHSLEELYRDLYGVEGL